MCLCVLERVHHVHGDHRLLLCVLGVGHCVPDDILQEHLEDIAGFLIGETTDALHTTPMGKTMDCRLGDALDVLTKNIPMTICTSLAKTLASFTASSHGECSCA